MYKDHLRVFLTGRAAAFLVLIVFQIVLVRSISTEEYAKYAFSFAVASFVQVITSFGIPRIISKYVASAGTGFTNSAVKKLLILLLSMRFVGSAIALFLVLALIALFSPSLLDAGNAFLLSVGIYILASAFLLDLDSSALALMLQRPSRASALGEPVLRTLSLLLLINVSGTVGATEVFLISGATASIFSIFLLATVQRRLNEHDGPPALPSINGVMATAFGGYASSLAWLTSSPAVVRLLASAALDLRAFAGFGFVQGLVMSVQRYTPGQLLFPFIEPAVMAGAPLANHVARMRVALSLTTKVDLALIGAMIVAASVSGPAIISFITGGRYEEAAAFLPWLLALIMANSCYRCYEIAAIALDAPHALTRSFPLSLAWLLGLWLAIPYFGTWSILLFPLADAATRVGIIQSMLNKRGTGSVLDFPVLIFMTALIIGIGVIGERVSAQLQLQGAAAILFGTFCSAVFLSLLLASRPLSSEEWTLVARHAPLPRKGA